MVTHSKNIPKVWNNRVNKSLSKHLSLQRSWVLGDNLVAFGVQRDIVGFH